MKKSDWQEGLKKLETLYKTAESNQRLASDQLEELDFTISKYKEKIETFK